MVTSVTRSHAASHIDTPDTPAANKNYLIGAGQALGHFAGNVLQVLGDGAYGALPAPLKMLEIGVSTLVGTEPVLLRVKARNEDRREGLAAFVSNPIGVTEKIALGIWNAFAHNDGSAEGKQRAGAAVAQLFVLAAPPLNVLKIAKPLAQSTTLHAAELGLSSKYIARVEIHQQASSTLKADFIHLYDASKAGADLKGIWLYDMVVHRVPDWLTLPRQITGATKSGDAMSAIARLKDLAALGGNKTLSVTASFHDKALAGVFKRRYKAQRINNRRSHNAFDGRLPIYTAHIPISEKFAHQAQLHYNNAITSNAITWHGIAAAAHDTPLPATALSFDFTSPLE